MDALEAATDALAYHLPLIVASGIACVCGWRPEEPETTGDQWGRHLLDILDLGYAVR